MSDNLHVELCKRLCTYYTQGLLQGARKQFSRQEFKEKGMRAFLHHSHSSVTGASANKPVVDFPYTVHETGIKLVTAQTHIGSIQTKPAFSTGGQLKAFPCSTVLWVFLLSQTTHPDTSKRWQPGKDKVYPSWILKHQPGAFLQLMKAITGVSFAYL